MQGMKKILFYLFVMVCAFFLILSNGQAIYASQTNTNQVQTVQNSTNNLMIFPLNWNTLWDYIKLVGGSLLGIITMLIAIYKFVLEKKYVIENVEIDLINRKLPEDTKYIDYVCKKISINSRIVEEIDYPNPYYLDISIKIDTPDGKKTLNGIVIKKMILIINEYKFLCIPKMKDAGSYPKCPFNEQKGKESCEILLKWPAIKDKNDRLALNPTEIFRYPNCLKMYVTWYPSIILSPIFGFIFPQKKEIVFEKIKHENGSPRIRIKSIGIYKEEMING